MALYLPKDQNSTIKIRSRDPIFNPLIVNYPWQSTQYLSLIKPPRISTEGEKTTPSFYLRILVLMLWCCILFSPSEIVGEESAMHSPQPFENPRLEVPDSSNHPLYQDAPFIWDSDTVIYAFRKVDFIYGDLLFRGK